MTVDSAEPGPGHPGSGQRWLARAAFAALAAALVVLVASEGTIGLTCWGSAYSGRRRSWPVGTGSTPNPTCAGESGRR